MVQSTAEILILDLCVARAQPRLHVPYSWRAKTAHVTRGTMMQAVDGTVRLLVPRLVNSVTIELLQEPW
jgi:hypothetical protein